MQMTYRKSAPKYDTINRHENIALSYSLPETGTGFWYRFSAPISGMCVIGIIVNVAWEVGVFGMCACPKIANAGSKRASPGRAVK